MIVSEHVHLIPSFLESYDMHLKHPYWINKTQWYSYDILYKSITGWCLSPTPLKHIRQLGLRHSEYMEK